MNVAQVCADLIQINTENPPGRTDEAVEYVAEILEGLGYRPRISKSPGGHWNVCAGPHDCALLFCGHLDVVPAGDVGWTHDPFSGVIEDGFVWGRGSTDMKGGCAAILVALEWMADTYDKQSLSDDLSIGAAFVCDEETGRVDGVQHLLRINEFAPCDCLIAEPTPYLNPAIGQKGLCRFEATFRGQPGHGSLYPFAGVNAIVKAVGFIDRLIAMTEKEYLPDTVVKELVTNSEQAIAEIFPDTDVSRLLTRITCNPGKIWGGEGANIVAEECTVAMDMRLPWGCTPEAVLAAARQDPSKPDICPMSLAPPTCTPPDSVLVRRLCTAIESAYGLTADDQQNGQSTDHSTGQQQQVGHKVRPILQWAASDARFLRAAGFRAAEYGPGEIHLLHAQDERVRVDQLEKTVQVYEALIASYL